MLNRYKILAIPGGFSYGDDLGSGKAYANKLNNHLKKHIADFTVSYKPDYRQIIANSWPQSIDDSVARKDWGWKEEYDLSAMTSDMFANL